MWFYFFFYFCLHRLLNNALASCNLLLPAGLEAKRVFDDAQRLLNKMIDAGTLKGKGLVGFWPAQSQGDDINVYGADVTAPRQTQPIAKFHGLRQQVSPLQFFVFFFIPSSWNLEMELCLMFCTWPTASFRDRPLFFSQSLMFYPESQSEKDASLSLFYFYHCVIDLVSSIRVVGSWSSCVINQKNSSWRIPILSQFIRKVWTIWSQYTNKAVGGIASD